MGSTISGHLITVSFNGAEPLPCEFSVHTERIDVSTLTASKPDMDWTFVDAAGHFHAYDHEGKLPTIVYREEEVSADVTGSMLDADNMEDVDLDDDEYAEWSYTVTHIECGLCGEEIEPKRLPDNPHKTIAGRTEYKVTVQAEVPAGRLSVLVNTPGRLWFGFGQGYATGGEMIGGEWRPTFEAYCGPMSWRPLPEPEKPKPDIWSRLAEQAEERERSQ